MNARFAPSRALVMAGFTAVALAVASGCGGGGGSSSGPAPTTPTTAPTTAGSSVTVNLAVGPGLTPTDPLTGIALGTLGSTTGGSVTVPAASAAATLTITLQTALPTGVVAPSKVARAPLSIGGSGLSAIAFASATSTVTTTMPSTPAITLNFASALPSSVQYIYVAEYSYTTQTWTTLGAATIGTGRTSLTLPGFTPAITYTAASPTWFTLFTVTSALPTATPTPTPTPTPTVNPTAIPTSAPTSAPTLGATAAPLPPQLEFLPSGFYGEVIASGLTAPRQLVALPNGDLLYGTDDKSGTVWIVPNTETAGGAGTPKVFLTVPNVSTQEPAQGLAFDAVHSKLYVATNQSVWQVPYKTGDQSEPTPTVEVAKVRRGSIAPHSDGDVHFTTSVAVVPSTNTLYVGVGSSCNACVESDPTRGTIQAVNLSTLAQTTYAARFRNPLAMAVNPATNTMWAGGAGQDDVIALNGSIVPGVNNPVDGHPYEFFDPVTTHPAVPDYGWPECEEDNVPETAVVPGATCFSTWPGQSSTKDIIPAVELFAYSTIIGATFYPAGQTGTYAFPSSYKGGAFLSMHGSWHENQNGNPLSVPEVVYVPISANDKPTIAVNFNNSGAQWMTLLYGFQDQTSGIRVGRPVGLAVGVQGSLFVADDYAGVIYRIRPGSGPASRIRRTR